MLEFIWIEGVRSMTVGQFPYTNISLIYAIDFVVFSLGVFGRLICQGGGGGGGSIGQTW